MFIRYMYLIGNHRHIVAQTNLTDAAQFIACPYASGRIVGVAQQQHCGTRMGSALFESLEINGIATIGMIIERTLAYLAAVVAYRREKAVVDGVCTITPGAASPFIIAEMAGTTPEVYITSLRSICHP